MATSSFVSCIPWLCLLAIAPFFICTGNSQVLVPSTVINCTIYNASRPCLPGDRSIFCLTNGTTIRGICDAQKAVCEENQEVADNLDPCSTIVTTAQPNNTATTAFVASSTHCTSLQVISSSFLVWIWHAYFH